VKCERCQGPMIVANSKAIEYRNDMTLTLKIVCPRCYDTLWKAQGCPSYEDVRFVPMKLLFACSFGQIRSVTAQALYGGKYIEDGLSGASPSLIRRLSAWADRIFIFEPAHEWSYHNYYIEFVSKLINLNIEDIYPRAHDPRLITIIQDKYRKVKYQ